MPSAFFSFTQASIIVKELTVKMKSTVGHKLTILMGCRLVLSRRTTREKTMLNVKYEVQYRKSCFRTMKEQIISILKGEEMFSHMFVLLYILQYTRDAASGNSHISSCILYNIWPGVCCVRLVNHTSAVVYAFTEFNLYHIDYFA